VYQQESEDKQPNSNPFSATFDITLWYQEKYPWSQQGEYLSLSNMPVINTVCESGWCYREFQRTVIMPTYLTVFAIVDFGSVLTETTLEKTPAALYARKQTIGELGQPISGVSTTNPMWFPARCTERITDKFGEVLGNYSDQGVPKVEVHFSV
jgi:hypothetical protein